MHAKKGTRIWKILAKSYAGDSVFQEYGDFLAKNKSISSLANSSDEALGQIAGEIDSEVTCMLSEKWVQEGDRYYYKMCFDEAQAAYDNSLYYLSNYPPALLGNWRTFCKRGMAEEAKQCLEMLFSLDTSLPQKGKDVLLSISQRTFFMRSYCKGYAFLDLGNANAAHTAFREMHQQIATPSDKSQQKLCAKAYCGEGDTFINEGRRASNFQEYYNQAISAYEKAKSFDADDPIYLTRIGDVYVTFAQEYAMLNNRALVNDFYHNALEIYKQIISRDSYPPAHIGQGDISFLQDNFTKALESYEKALELYESALSYDQYVAHAHGGKGNALLALNDSEQALLAFEQALSIDDSDARYHYGKGQALTQLKNYQAALESYKIAIRYDIRQSKKFLIDYARVYIELGDIENIYGQQSNTNEYYTKAENVYQRVFDPRRTEKGIEYGYGKIYFARKNWNAALICYDKALSLDPFMSEAYLGKGKTYLELENYEAASDCFKHANKYCQRPEFTIDKSDVEATYGDAYYLIAQHHSSLEDRDDALEKARSYYERAITRRENAIAYAGLGKTYAGLRRDQEAIDALNHALELMPNLIQCYFIKGRCYDSLCQYSDAYIEYEKASNAGLNMFSLQSARGEVLLNLKRHKEATRVFHDIIEHIIHSMFNYNMAEYTEKELVYAYCSKGIALHKQELDQEALMYFLHAFYCDPSVMWRHRYALQEIHFNFERKLCSNPNDSTIYKCNGDVLRLLGDQDEKAIKAYTAAIAYGDTSVDTYYSRALIYEKIQDYQNAFSDYCTVLQIDQNHQAAQQAKLRVESKLIQPQTSFWQKFKPLLKLFS